MERDNLITKIDLLSEENKKQVMNFIDFLSEKDDRITLENMKQSLDDLKNGNIEVIENKKDLNKHFKKVGI